jgi:predicted NBD/HSP70 family sugar kinase
MPIGVDVADARVIAVVVDDAGQVLSRAQGTDSADLVALVRTLPQVSAAGADTPLSVGVAAVAPDAPALTPALAALKDAGLVPAEPVVASGTAAATAESWIGAGAGARTMVFFSVGEHTTGGIVRDGAPTGGAHGRAMAVGWLALNPVEREDYRKMGCLETEVAAAGIVRRLVWRIKVGDHSSVQDIVGADLASITIEQVFQAARDGDGVAISIVRDTAKYLGMAATNLVAVTDPDRLVLGGIMASAADLLFEPVRAEVYRRLPRSMTDGLAVVPALLGDDAAAIGAARLAALALQ